MSVFTAHSMIEQLEEEISNFKEEISNLKEEISNLKFDKRKLSDRVLNMTSMLTKNRIAANKTLNDKNKELETMQLIVSDKTYLYELMRDERNTAKEEHLTHKNSWNNLMDLRDDEITELKETVSERDYEIAELKEMLSERNDEIANLKTEISYENDNESMLAIKNGELQTQIGLLSEQHTDAIESMRAQLLASETKYTETRTQLERAAGMLSAISTASAYITDILSHLS
jgi:DNA repair exonuclease SbcCD ATPase subunit